MEIINKIYQISQNKLYCTLLFFLSLNITIADDNLLFSDYLDKDKYSRINIYLVAIDSTLGLNNKPKKHRSSWFKKTSLDEIQSRSFSITASKYLDSLSNSYLWKPSDDCFIKYLYPVETVETVEIYHELIDDIVNFFKNYNLDTEAGMEIQIIDRFGSKYYFASTSHGIMIFDILSKYLSDEVMERIRNHLNSNDFIYSLESMGYPEISITMHDSLIDDFDLDYILNRPRVSLMVKKHVDSLAQLYTEYSSDYSFDDYFTTKNMKILNRIIYEIKSISKQRNDDKTLPIFVVHIDNGKKVLPFTIDYSKSQNLIDIISKYFSKELVEKFKTRLKLSEPKNEK